MRIHDNPDSVPVEGELQICDSVSMPTANVRVYSAFTDEAGRVVEFVRLTYSQGLHKYLYFVYESQEVRD